MIIVSEKYVCKYLSETNCIEYNANFNITIHYFTVISSVFQSYVADSFCVRHNMVKEIDRTTEIMVATMPPSLRGAHNLGISTIISISESEHPIIFVHYVNYSVTLTGLITGFDYSLRLRVSGKIMFL